LGLALGAFEVTTQSASAQLTEKKVLTLAGASKMFAAAGEETTDAAS
jgi:hypothetical protein